MTSSGSDAGSAGVWRRLLVLVLVRLRRRGLPAFGQVSTLENFVQRGAKCGCASEAESEWRDT
jgi:hypothetical protein